MGPTMSLRRPATGPGLPLARLHGAEADFDRARRSFAGGFAVVLVWLLPAIAMAVTIAVTT